MEYSGFSTYRFPIIFEGEYLNGERNGKGKEYLLSPFVLDPILIYEGEYLNGKRNGKGKEYDSKGILIFEGEYLNGKKWSGIGPSAPKKVLPPEGEIFGIDYIKGRKFVIKDGKGFSIELFKAWLSIAFFISEYLNGERNGKGIGYIKSFKEGEISFKGEYINGKLNGKVEMEGREVDKKEKKSEIDFINGKANGKGKEFYKNGNLKFEGEFLYNHKIKGKEYDINGKLIYEGEYFDVRNGKGKEYLDNRLIFEGEYLNGRRWKGIGKEYNNKNKLIFEGEYLDGQRWNGREINHKSRERKIINGKYESKCIIL